MNPTPFHGLCLYLSDEDANPTISTLFEVVAHAGKKLINIDMETMSGVSFTSISYKQIYPHDGYIIWANQQPRPFAEAYTNKEAMIFEFIEQFGKYIPKNFNWDDHLGEISGCFLN